MPQTMLALLGLMIAITFAFNAQRETVQSRQQILANELEVMATGIALQTMETIRTRAFDQAVIKMKSPAVSDFSTIQSGKKCRVFNDGRGAPCDALEDFNRMRALPLEFDMGGGKTIPFRVRSEVTYVDDNFQPVTYPTRSKQVTVYVIDQSMSGDPLMRSEIHLRRTFSYNFVTGGTSSTENGAGHNQGGHGKDKDKDKGNGNGNGKNKGKGKNK